MKNEELGIKNSRSCMRSTTSRFAIPHFSFPVPHSSFSLFFILARRLIQDDEGADLRRAVLEGDRLVEPGLAVDAFDDAPGHLILEEVDVLAGGNLDLLPIADD